MKAIVLCYSFEGNTLRVSEILGKEFNLEVYQIKPEKDLKSKGFSKFLWGGRQVILGKKPQLEPLSFSIDEVDFIFLGSPIWAGTFAPAIKTLLETGILKNKKIAYFYTHEGGASRARLLGEKAINIHNHFVGAYSIKNVIKGDFSWLQDFLSWGRNVLEENSVK